MPTTVQFRRGTAAQNDSFTGNSGEISYDTTNETIRIHDGSNAGGSRLATYVEVTDRLQVANAAATYSTLTQLGNTNSYIATESARIDLVNTNLTSTNTAIRALVSDRLQVANASVLYVTKATAVTSNNALLNLINDRMQVANVSSLVSTEVSNLVDSAPETLNTLNELAAALGDDANFAATTAASLGTKASNTYVNTTFVTKATAVSSNNALKTLIDDRLQVANASVLYVTKATALSTNNAIVNLVNDRLQVANAAATYSTLTQLGNTNSYIAAESARINLVNTNLTSTNTAIRALVSDRLQVANANQTFETKAVALAANNAQNSLINDRLQVANAAVLYVTKSTAVSSNNALKTLINDRLQVANATATFSTLTQLGNTNSYIASVQSNLDATNANVDQKLGATASVTLTGDVSGSASFSANAVSITTTVSDDSHNHSSSSGNFTVGGDLTVSGGDITLSGTGRIQGIDTVSAGTDAASKTYVDNAVAAIVDTAPEALNTLNELAAALGDDANFATTTATALGTKASNTYVNSTFSTLTQLGNTNSYIATKANASTQVIAGNGLTGGGTLEANRTLNIGAGTGITVSADAISTNDSAIVHDNLSGFVANEHIDHSTVSITAGDGLTGGGTIAATRTIAVGAGTLIDVTADAVNVDLSELTTSTSDADGDFFVVVDSANAQKKLTKANINISGFNNDAGFSTTTGTVTSVAVTAGTGLSGGGTVTSSGTIALAVDLSELTDMTAGMVGTDEFIVLDAGADRRKAANEIGLSIFNNDAGFSTTTGTVTSVATGGGLTGGTITSSGTISHADTSSQASVNNSGATVIQDVTLDTYGHVTGLASKTMSYTDVGAPSTTGTNASGTWGISITGNAATATSATSATSATNATNFNVAADNSTNATHYPIFTGGATGNQRPNSDTGLTYNPSTGTMTSVDFNATSDVNLKYNIETISDPLEKVLQLRGVNFNWKKNDVRAMGVIAQEVEEVIPEVVGESEGNKSVNYGAMVGLLIEVVKDQQKQIDELKQIINS